jgi:pimeloyl-ACP methyl ester carboxylesterase
MSERDVEIEVLVEGNGQDVVLLPSAERSARDFAQLAGALAASGFGSIAINPRGVGGSEGPVDGITMADVAADIAGVVEALVGLPVHLVGHALGNTFARATASYRPDVVRSLALLACGGHNLATATPSPEVMRHFARCPRSDVADFERLESLRVAFFASGSDPTSWLEGWWPGGRGVVGALQRSDPSEWWRGGDVPVLIVQPLEDAMAPPEVGRELSAALGGRVRYVELSGCGHALLPEQPEALADVLVGFLRDQDRSEARCGDHPSGR